MHADGKSVLLALLLMVVMVMPVGLVGAGVQHDKIKEEVVNEDDTPFITDSDNVKIEKVDPSTMGKAFEKIELPELEGTPTLDTRLSGVKVPGVDTDLSQSLRNNGFHPVRSMDMAAPTRASDTSNNDDPFNGSKISSNGEVVTGDIFYPATDPTGDRGDYIDWYKMEFTGIDPNVPGALQNVTFQLNSFSSDEVTLYELQYQVDAQGQITEFGSDILDYISVFIVYMDPFWGFEELGGAKFWYDNGVDDGWSYTDNWTTNFRTPDKSHGVEDTNGMTGGLTEDGWYYIGVSYSYWVTPEAPDRDDFYVDYEFEVSWTGESNNFPFSDTYTAGAPNDLNNATGTLPTMPGRIHSGLNHFDWYSFEGVNNEYIWNMSLWFNVTWSTISVGLEISVWDWWTTIIMLWWGAGDDGQYDTDDDIWTYDPMFGYKILYYNVYLATSTGDPLPWFQNRYTQTGQNNQQVNIWNINNRTDAQATHPYIQGENPRKMFVGIFTAPQKFQQTSTGGLAQVYADYQASDDYTLELNVKEVAPNNPPEISDITVSSDFPQSDTGGYYDTEFQINVTYMDEDNDPPSELLLVFDEGTGAETAPVDILQDGDPIDLNDNDYTDGREYKITYLGKTLKDTPSPHSIKVWAKDDPSHPMKTARWSLPRFDYNLTVWDDDPVSVKDPWAGIPTLQEDEPPRLIPLEGFDGAFKDPENRFRGFNIWDPTNETWATDYFSELMHINISKIDGIWQMNIMLNENQHSTAGEPVTLRAYDDHSWAVRTTRVYVNPVNDPPKVLGIKIGSNTYDEDTGELDNTDPLSPVVHFEGVEQAKLVEDQFFEFEIIAEDTDLEEERQDLEYDFETGLSSPWKELPSVGYNTGIVTLENGISNDDVKKKNNKMAFSISDRGTDGTIILTIYFDVENVNDPPSITIPTTTPRQYTQYQAGGIRIKPIASDIDPGDSLTFSVNFEDPLEYDGEEVDSIVDQLPNMEARKDIDWGVDTNTGEFWFKPDDQNIWNTSSGWVKSIEITLVFEVRDKAGATATDKITLVLNDLNEEPEAPSEIKADPDPSQEIYVGDEITFSVDEVTDPDGDKVTYKWDFGDGATGEGRTVTHTYSKKGWKTVQMWVEDGQFETDRINLRLEILEKEDTNGGGNNNQQTPTTPSSTSSSDNTMLYVILGVVGLLVVIIVIVIFFFALRKKEAPPAQQYPMYDTMGAYGAQGLPPGQENQLPPGAAPELPPGQDYYQQPDQLPPAGQEQVQPQTEAPAAQPETQAQPEAPAGSTCPSCGAPVDPSWFLCPNCKTPLQ